MDKKKSQKSVSLLYINDKQTENEMKETSSTIDTNKLSFSISNETIYCFV